MASEKGPIIILEDDSDEQELLADAFQNLEVKNELKFFIDGQSLIDYLKTTSDQPFLILSDVNVPLLNGLEAKAYINNDDYLRRKSIPFVFLSTSAEKKAVEQAYDINSQGYFMKQGSIAAIERNLSIILQYWKECRHTNS